jgi:hypothetical protein
MAWRGRVLRVSLIYRIELRFWLEKDRTLKGQYRHGLFRIVASHNEVLLVSVGGELRPNRKHYDQA